LTPVPGVTPILTYHSLDASGSVISLAPQTFRRHMELLHEGGRRGIALGDLIEAWEGRAELPARAVVVTFDDGFRNVADHAAPVLARLGFRATIFAVAGHCGGHNDWPTQPRDVPRLPLLSLPELRELTGAGFEIGSHGLHHAPLDEATPAIAEAEIVGSRRTLEDALGSRISTFAYPYGLANAEARGLVRSHYDAACSTELRQASRLEDRHFLSRIDAYYFQGPALFRTLGTTAGGGYLALRRLARRARRAVLSGRGPA
jgi:peptidoglycan/xylan/chitin deacetylase (PgdA/CDA1 family)